MIVLYLLGVLVGAIVLMIVIGAVLPRDHVATRRGRIPRSPEIVYADLTTVDAFPSWRKDVTRVEPLPPREGRTSWREVGRHGAIAMEIVESAAPRRLVTRIADPKLPFGGTWTYELAPDGDGTVLTITEDGQVHNPMFRFMSRFVFGHTATLDAYLRALAAKYGEQISPSSGNGVA